MAVVLAAAAIVHLVGKDFSKLPMILVLLVLAITLTFGRYYKIAG